MSFEGIHEGVKYTVSHSHTIVGSSRNTNTSVLVCVQHGTLYTYPLASDQFAEVAGHVDGVARSTGSLEHILSTCTCSGI